MQPVAWISPLWHGTELARAAALGRRPLAALAALGHVVFLLALLAVGVARSRCGASAGGCTHDAPRVPLPDVAGPDVSRVRAPARVGPAASSRGLRRAGERAGAALRHRLAASWLAFVSGFFEPVFYLVAMGSGARRAGRHAARPRRATPIPYAAFIAPGLLAAAAMNGAVFDSTFNVFFKLKYNRLYDAVLATPLGPVDIALGEIGWALLRAGSTRWGSSR